MKKGFLVLLVIIIFILLFCSEKTKGQCNGASWSARASQVNQVDHDKKDHKKYEEIGFLMRYRVNAFGLIANGRVIGDSSASVAGGFSLCLRNATLDFLIGPKYFINDQQKKETVAEFQLRGWYAPSENFELRGLLYAADEISGRGDILYYPKKNGWFAGGLTAESDYGYGVVVQISPTKNIDILGRAMTNGTKDSRDRYRLTTRIECVLTF